MAERDNRADDAELDELRDLMASTRPDEIEWESPPPGTWERIAAAVEASPRQTTGATPAAAPPTSRRRWIVGAALAAAAAALIAVTVAVIRGDDDPTRVVAAVELEPLGTSGSGRAELVDRDGVLQLQLQTEGLDPGDGYLELWLIDPTVTRLVSLGPLRDDGVYDVPANVDPAEFPIVDVSVEPIDGDPTHGGDSVLRGEFPL
jgi:anti-sigma-K factor RskA